MFRKILVPLDLSDKHQSALECAAALARDHHGEVALLHVIETIADLPVDEDRAFFARLQAVARKHLDRAGSHLAQKQVPWSAEIRFGHRAAEIVRRAAEIGSDLIVLTAPRFQPDNPVASWSSVSHKVSFFAQCPILLVK
jgi:nucleotide-binding universal stress UspA family protein